MARDTPAAQVAAPAAVDAAAAPAPTPRSWISWAFTPDDSLSYDFLSAVYAFLAAISIMLFAAEHAFEAEGVKGYWIITAPCIPGLLYFLVLRHIARGRAAAVHAKKD